MLAPFENPLPIAILPSPAIAPYVPAFVSAPVRTVLASPPAGIPIAPKPDDTAAPHPPAIAPTPSAAPAVNTIAPTASAGKATFLTTFTTFLKTFLIFLTSLLI
jgi:hypothetical protein